MTLTNCFLVIAEFEVSQQRKYSRRLESNNTSEIKRLIGKFDISMDDNEK